MKNYSHLPTEENVSSLFYSDSIGRRKYIFKFIELLSCIDERCSIAVSGSWGSGKTFFVKQTKLVLDALNPQSSLDLPTREKVLTYLPEAMQHAGSVATLYYDAWLYDHYENPLLTLIYSSIASGQSTFSPEKNRSLINILAAIGEVLTERNIPSLVKEVRGTDIFIEEKTVEHIGEQVKEFLSTLIEERGDKLVIFIDELDRCNPSFAVKLLEQLKHYFDDDRVTIVFSVSLTQLQSTIKKYYGESFCATRYLDKFFDFRMSLPEINYEEFFNNSLDFSNNFIVDKVCLECAKYFEFSLRECERYARLMKIAIRFAYDKLPRGFSEENALLYCVNYFLPIAIALEMTDSSAYDRFLNGSDSVPMWDILNHPDILPNQKFILGAGEILNENEDGASIYTHAVDGTEDIISLRSRLEHIYHMAFSRESDLFLGGAIIGEMRFSNETKKTFMEMLSLLSPYSRYEID